MKASIRALGLLAILALPVAGRAAFRMNDFAYGLRLAPPEQSGLVRVVLPETVYRHMARSDAGDIAIFRMDGRPVPHLLERPPAADGTVHPTPLPFSPLGNETPGKGRPDVSVGTNPGRALPGRSGAPVTGEEKAAPAYLIDHSGLPRGLAKLTLVWQRNRPNVLVNVRLETGRDLTHWQPLVPAVSLWDIRHGEWRLENRTIVLPVGKPQDRYFKLSWISGADAVMLKAVEGVPVLRPPLPPRRWVRAAYRTDQQAPGSMQFDSGGWFPVDQVDLRFSQGNSLLVGTLQSRDAERAVWRIHYQGLFYQLTWEDQILRNLPVSLPETADRHWKLDIDPRRSRLGNNVPRLMLGWRPQALFFKAERGGAYLLAYGSRTAEALPPPADLTEARAAAGERIATLAIGPAITLGGYRQAKASPRRTSGRMVSLSSLLLGCVLLFAFFAWRLVRRLLRIDSQSFR